jgi:hypothetical protein
MNRRDTIIELHKIIDTRLFDDCPWYSYRESTHALHKKLDELGLQQPWGADPLARMSTELGNELNLGLVLVFLGVWDIWNVPYKLEQYGLLDEDEFDPIFEKMCRVSPDDWKFGCPEMGAILRPVVQRAYWDFYHPNCLCDASPEEPPMAPTLRSCHH